MLVDHIGGTSNGRIDPMAWNEKKPNGQPPHVSLRKRLKSKAEAHNPGRPLGWRGGILYFLDMGDPVPNVQQVPKPDRRAIGWAGCGAQVLPLPVTVYRAQPFQGTRERAGGNHSDTRWRGHDARLSYGYTGRD